MREGLPSSKQEDCSAFRTFFIPNSCGSRCPCCPHTQLLSRLCPLPYFWRRCMWMRVGSSSWGDVTTNLLSLPKKTLCEQLLSHSDEQKMAFKAVNLYHFRVRVGEIVVKIAVVTFYLITFCQARWLFCFLPPLSLVSCLHSSTL